MIQPRLSREEFLRARAEHAQRLDHHIKQARMGVEAIAPSSVRADHPSRQAYRRAQRMIEKKGIVQ
ncbi:hypothetical protein ACKU27_11105 [Sphingobium yanoikuyae]|uniref:hypothetical protein n=1 Tax=Sphingobium yanoikuyae TaxID=13690 RepID=UPI003B8F99EE